MPSIAHHHAGAGEGEQHNLHRMNDPRQVAELGGMQRRLEVTHRYDAKAGQPLKEGQIRYEESATIDPTKVMQLATGAAYIIN